MYLQAIAFVAGQRETLLLALKDCAAHPMISSLQEAHLIVTLLGIVTPAIPDEDLVSLILLSQRDGRIDTENSVQSSLSSFGGLHSTILSLSAKLCGSQEWISKVVPTNDTEREDDTILVMCTHTFQLI